jgi:heat shock protein HslJ
MSCVGAQTLPDLPPQDLADLGPQSSAAQRFEQAWDVVELMGQPMLGDAQRPARVLIRPQGGIWVDGGCNYFSGRIERDVPGLFRVSKYGGTHSACDKPPRSEALLNSALMMVDNYRWDRGLVLRSGDNELVRLQPSANQNSQDIEQGLVAGRPAPAPAPAPQAVGQDCRQVKVARSAKSKTGRAKAAGATRLVCKPARQGAKSGKAKASRQVGKAKAARAKASKAKPAATRKP